jgi:hypothetical protein
MTKPGRVSATAAEVPAIQFEAPPPPPELEEPEMIIWRAITGRQQPGWFTAENRVMVKELCRHIRPADDLARDIAKLRAATTGRIDVKQLATLLRLHGLQSERISNLSTKLRLTSQARMSGTRAEQLSRKLGAAPKPWEDW